MPVESVSGMSADGGQRARTTTDAHMATAATLGAATRPMMTPPTIVATAWTRTPSVVPARPSTFCARSATSAVRAPVVWLVSSKKAMSWRRMLRNVWWRSLRPRRSDVQPNAPSLAICARAAMMAMIKA